MQPESVPTSDEKMMGALAHLLGLVVALVVWAVQKEKSRFVRFQAIQAMAFDGVIMVVSTVSFFCLFTLMSLGMVGSLISTINDPASINDFPMLFLFPTIMPFLIFTCIFPLSFVMLIVRLIAAISVLNGRDFRYPLIGKWTEKFLKE
jgi:uncharacterized Tic20 family protein